MHKTVLLMILLMCVQVACRGSRENAIPENVVIASRAESDVVIDGLLNEPVWQGSQLVVLRENRSGESVIDTTVLTVVRTCHDGRDLFISFVCNDPDIWGNFTDRDQHLWTEEAVEVFIDTDDERDTYVEIEVSPKNVLFDSYIVDPENIDIEATAQFDLSGIRTAVSVDGSLNKRDDRDRHWIVEMAIPFVDMVNDFDRLELSESKWKINFYRINRDGDAKSVGYAWSPTGARFHKPSVFGTLAFE